MVEPVCMLPHVDAHYWHALDLSHSHHQVVVHVVCLSYYQVTVWPHAQPNPSRQQSVLYFRPEGLFEVVEVGKVLVDCLKELMNTKS